MKLYLVIVVLLISYSSLAKKNYNFGNKLKSSIGPTSSISRSMGNLFLSKRQCINIAKNRLKESRKVIISFSVGNKIQNTDIYGGHTQGYLTGGYGKYAKIGLPDDHNYQVNNMSTQFAIHADPRCGKYARVKKVDQTVYKGKLCRRIFIKIGSLNYKTFFCSGDKKGYVDHFDLTQAI